MKLRADIRRRQRKAAKNRGRLTLTEVRRINAQRRLPGDHPSAEPDRRRRRSSGAGRMKLRADIRRRQRKAAKNRGRLTLTEVRRINAQRRLPGDHPSAEPDRRRRRSSGAGRMKLRADIRRRQRKAAKNRGRLTLTEVRRINAQRRLPGDHPSAEPDRRRRRSSGAGRMKLRADIRRRQRKAAKNRGRLTLTEVRRINAQRRLPGDHPSAEPDRRRRRSSGAGRMKLRADIRRRQRKAAKNRGRLTLTEVRRINAQRRLPGDHPSAEPDRRRRRSSGAGRMKLRADIRRRQRKAAKNRGRLTLTEVRRINAQRRLPGDHPSAEPDRRRRRSSGAGRMKLRADIRRRQRKAAKNRGRLTLTEVRRINAQRRLPGDHPSAEPDRRRRRSSGAGRMNCEPIYGADSAKPRRTAADSPSPRCAESTPNGGSQATIPAPTRTSRPSPNSKMEGTSSPHSNEPGRCRTCFGSCGSIPALSPLCRWSCCWSAS